MESAHNNKGYVVSLYKRVPSANLSDYEALFDFIAFMNFDGIAVEPVNCFEEYVKLPSQIKVDSDDKWNGFNDDVFRGENDTSLSASCFCEQQNMLLYIDESQEHRDKDDIFSCGEDYNYPVLLITLLEFKEKTNHSFTDHRLIMQRNSERMKSLKGIKHCVFGSLGSADYVIVTRAETFSDAFSATETLRSCDKSLKTIYTIPAIQRGSNKDQIWITNEEAKIKAGEKVYISLRLAINPSADIEEVSKQIVSESGIEIVLPYKKDDLASKKGLIPAMIILGKYDIEIIGTLENPKKFLSAFSQANGIFNAKSDFYKTNIYITNTKFMLVGGDINKTSVKGEGNESTDIQNIIAYIKKFKEGEFENLTSTERILLVRLLLKIIHIKTSLHKNNADDEILELPKLLIDKMATTLCALRENTAEKSVEETNQFYECLKCALVYLDNRIMIGRKDFEAPHGAWLSLGESSSLMLAYSSLAKRIAKSLEDVRNYEKEEEEYITFNFYVNAVSSHEVKLRKLKGSEDYSNAKGWRYGFFELPYGIINKIDIVIALTLHEAGHLYRCNRVKRNERFVSKDGKYNNGTLATIIKYNFREIAYSKNPENQELAPFLVKKIMDRIDSKCPDVREGSLENLRKEIEIGLLESLLKYKRESILNYYFDNKTEDKIRVFIEGVKEDIENLANQWSEAFADIYLVKTLKIETVKEYMEMHKKIFRMQKNTMSFEPSFFTVRYAAVLGFIMLKDYPKGIRENEKRKKINEAILELGIEDIALENRYSYMHTLIIFLEEALEEFGGQIDLAMENSKKYREFSEEISKHYKNLTKERASFKEQYEFFSDYNSRK